MNVRARASGEASSSCGRRRPRAKPGILRRGETPRAAARAVEGRARLTDGGTVIAVIAILAGSLVGGCVEAQRLVLLIRNPCDQEVLQQTEELQLTVATADGKRSEEVVWKTAQGGGEWTDVPRYERALVSLVGWRQASTRAIEAPSAGATLGYLDLTKGESRLEPVRVGLVMGRVDAFATTTDVTDNAGECTYMLAERRGHTATLLDDGRVFIVGGDMDMVADRSLKFWETTELYDPRTGTFRSGPTEKGGRRDHTATKLFDGRVLIVGGVGGTSGGVQTWESATIYDPESNAFREDPSMQEQRSAHTATLLSDGTVLIAGGTNGGEALSTTEIFDPDTMGTRPGPTLSTARFGHSAVLVAPRTVAVIGGRDRNQVLDSVEFVTAGQDAATPGPTLSTPRCYTAAVAVEEQGAVLVAGGFTSLPEAGIGQGSDAMEIIRLFQQDLAESTVDCSDLTLAEPRGAASLIAIPEGVLLVGGLDDLGVATASAEIIIPSDVRTCDIDTFPTTEAMSTARAGAAIAPLIGGDVLVTGGFHTAEGHVASIVATEIYIRPRDGN